MEWVKNHPAIATAFIAAASAIVGGLVAAGAKFVLDFYLSERIKRRWRTIDTKRRYSAQIIRAADELAGRLGNLSRHLNDGKATHWLRPLDDKAETPTIPFHRYYFSSTVYLLAQLISWIEVLKREQIFLDFATVKETRTFNAYLELFYSILSYSALTGSDSERQSKNYWIYYHYLGGIGQSLFANKDDDKLRCVTFHEFCSKFKSGEDDFRSWMREIEALIVSLSVEDNDVRWRRLQMLRLCLDQFLNFADPKMLRTTRNRMEPKDISADICRQVAEQAKYFGLKIKS